jgi:type IV pilus assembly protein PilC
VIVALLVLTAIAALAWFALQRSGKDRAVIEALILPLPLLGPVLRRNLLARWCDALRLGVEAGLDLPAAIRLANEAVGWSGLSKEGLVLAARIESGQPLVTDTPGYFIPPSVRASINFAAQGRDLPGNLKSLSDMYAEQAELRLALLQTFLPPLLLIVVASVIGLIIAALFLPLVKLIQGLT